MKKNLLDGRRIDFRHGYLITPPSPRIFNPVIPSETVLVTESASQDYSIGTQLKLGDNLWRFSKSGAAIAAGRRGFLKANHIQIPGKAGNSVHSGFEGAMAANVAAGATSFTIADTAALVNEYEGATLVVYDDVNNVYDQYRVIRNDVSNGVTTTLYIASPGFKHAKTTAMGITVYLNSYSGIRDFADGGGFASALGYAKFAITSGYYFWLLTAGPISGITGASTWPGQTQYSRDVYANTDGSLIGSNDTTDVIITKYQRIGYLLGRTASDYGDNFIMLQLDQ